MPQGKITKRKLSESDVSSSENSNQPDDEYLPQSTAKSSKKVKKPKQVAVNKSKEVLSNVSDSEEEPFVKNLQMKSPAEKSLQKNSLPDDGKFMSQTSFKGAVKRNKRIKKSKKILTDTTDSDNEPLVKSVQKKSAKKPLQNSSSDKDKFKPSSEVNESSKKTGHEEKSDSMSCCSTETQLKQPKSEEMSERFNVSSYEDEIITNLVEPKKEEIFKKEYVASSCSEDEPLIIQSKMDTSNLSKSSNWSPVSTNKDDSDEEDVRIPENRSEEDRSEKVSTCTISSDDEPLASSSKQSKSSEDEDQTSKGRQDSSSDEDEPISKIAASKTKRNSKKKIRKTRKHNQSGKSGHDKKEPSSKISEASRSKKVSISSSEFEDELSSIQKELSVEQSEVNGNVESSHTENGYGESSDEDEPLTKVAKRNEKSKRVSISSDDSSDVEFSIRNDKKKTPKKSQSSRKVLKKKSKPTEEDQDALLDEEVPQNVIAKTKSKKVSVPSCDSDDELSAIQKELSFEQPKSNGKVESRHPENDHDTTSDTDEPLAKITKTNGKSKRPSISSDGSSDEDFAIKNEKKKTPKKSQSSQKSPKKKLKPVEEDHCASSDTAPLTKIANTNEKSKRTIVSSDDEDDEDFAIKKNKKKMPQKPPKKKSSPSRESGSASSDDESEPLSKVAEKSKTKASTKKNSSNDRIEHFKKYLRTAGIRVKSYDALFQGCKSIKSKVDKLLDTLQEKGLKGKPTLEKCKKLRKKIETKQEVAELDTDNIIKTEGRSKRGGGALTPKNIPNSPAEKKFLRLKDIIDSEESD